MAYKMKSSVKELCSPLQSAENPSDNEIKTYVPGEDGPKYTGGSAPNPAKAAYNIVKTVGKGAKYLYNKFNS